MFPVKPTVKTGLDKVIDETIEDIRRHDLDTKEYQIAVDTLVKLYEMKAKTKPQTISPDTIATVAANLLGIAIIVGYERMNIVTSKALNFVARLR